MIAAISIWEKESFYASPDVLIAGSGLMGLWSAFELKRRKPSLRITILEKNSIPLGASTRNAGFACFGSPTELIADAERNGIDQMLSVAGMRYKGIEKIRKYFTEEEIAFEACGGYECINRDYKYWQELDTRIEWLNGLLKDITKEKNIFKRKDADIPGLGLRNFDALISNKTEAALHSGKLVQALTRKVKSMGVEIINGVTITHCDGSRIEAGDSSGRLLYFTPVQSLFCTNAFTEQLFPSLQVAPARGQVIVTAPIPGLPMKGTFHFEEGFYYWRHLGNRILIGGARNLAIDAEQTLSMEGSDTIREALEVFLQNHLHPTLLRPVETHWSGIMGFTKNKLPQIEKISDTAYAVIACNGMGVALTPVVAEQVATFMGYDF